MCVGRRGTRRAANRQSKNTLIAGMGHGAPDRSRSDDARQGHAGPFMLDVGISSTYQCALSWGITGPIVPIASPSKCEPAEAVPPLLRLRSKSAQ